MCYTPRPQTDCVAEPSTATILGTVSNCELDDFKKAIASAEVAGEEFYRSTTAHQKGALLRKWYELISANENDSKSQSAWEIGVSDNND